MDRYQYHPRFNRSFDSLRRFMRNERPFGQPNCSYCVEFRPKSRILGKFGSDRSKLPKTPASSGGSELTSKLVGFLSKWCPSE